MIPLYSNDKGYKSYGGGGVKEAVSSWLRCVVVTGDTSTMLVFSFLPDACGRGSTKAVLASEVHAFFELAVGNCFHPKHDWKQ